MRANISKFSGKFLAGALLLFFPGILSAQQISATLDQIRQVGDQRVNSIVTYHAKWQTTTTIMKGAYNEAAAVSLGPTASVQNFPPQDVVLTGTSDLTVSGYSSRRDTVQDLWNISRNDVDRDQRETYCFYNGVGKRLILDQQAGLISRKQITKDNVEVQPFADALDLDYLALPNYNVLRQAASKAGSLVVIGNTDFNQTASSGATRHEYFLDPKTSYLPVRHAAMLPDGRILTDTQIEYKKDSKVGSVPSKVSINVLNTKSGKIERSIVATLVSIDFNSSIDPTILDLSFPPGTEVIDEIKEMVYKVGEPGRGDNWVQNIMTKVGDNTPPAK